MAVAWERRGSAAIVTTSNPPVNAIRHETRSGMRDAAKASAAEKDIDRVTVAAAGTFFAAGADAREFDQRIRAYASEDRVVWKPSPLLERLATSGGRFADLTETRIER